jgi:hypothetical protein
MDSRPDSAEDSRAKLYGLSRCDLSCDSLPDVHCDSHGHRQGQLNRDSGRDLLRHLQDDLRALLRCDLWRDLRGLLPAKTAVRHHVCGSGLLGLTMTLTFDALGAGLATQAPPPRQSPDFSKSFAGLLPGVR